MTWEPYPDLDDDLVRALGLLTWEAIKLEGVMDRICEKVVADSTAKGMIKNHVDKVVKAIDHGTETRGRTAAKAWLNESLRALDARNAILHSITGLPFIEIDGELVPGEIQLVNKKLKNGIVQTTLTPLTTTALLAHHAIIARAYEKWRRVDWELALEDWAIVKVRTSEFSWGERQAQGGS